MFSIGFSVTSEQLVVGVDLELVSSEAFDEIRNCLLVASTEVTKVSLVTFSWLSSRSSSMLSIRTRSLLFDALAFAPDTKSWEEGLADSLHPLTLGTLEAAHSRSSSRLGERHAGLLLAGMPVTLSFISVLAFVSRSNSSQIPSASLEEEKLIPVNDESVEKSSPVDSLDKVSVLTLAGKLLASVFSLRPLPG